MSGRTYGYVRVSTKAQKEDRQLIAMRQFGIPEERIIIERQSGKDFERPVYLRLTQALRSGDVLVVKSIDRLGRNYKEILEQWAGLTKERGVAIVVLDMPLLDTRTDRDLTGVLIADIVLQLLSYVAQTEPAAAGRGDRRRQGTGRPVRAEAHPHAGAVHRAGRGLVAWPRHRRPGGKGAGRLPHHLQAPG